MTDNEKLIMLKAIIGTTSLTDETLSVYLTLAGQKVLKKLYGVRGIENREVPDQYATEQVELACNAVVKRGAEGQSSFTDNGVTRQYQSDDVILRRIVPFAYVPGVSSDETP